MDIRVFVCSQQLGVNPKVSNLSFMSTFARSDVLLVSDSNTRAHPGYLENLVSHLRSDVSLVSSPLVGKGEESVGARLENFHLNTFVATSVLSSHALGHPIVIGKSMLFRQSELELLGGWEAVADILAEDYVLGRRFQHKRRRVVLASQPLTTVNQSWSVERFLSRHLRWAQMRRNLSAMYFLEPLLYPAAFLFPLLTLLITSGVSDPRWKMAAGALFVLELLRRWLDEKMIGQLGGRSSRLLTLCLVPVRDMMMVLLWLIAIFRRTILWRGNRFLIEKDTRIRLAEGALAAREQTA